MLLDGPSPDRREPPNLYLLKVMHKKLAFPDLKRASVDPDTSFRPRELSGFESGKIHFESIFSSAKPSTNGRYLQILLKKSEAGVPRRSRFRAHSVAYTGSCHSEA